jgi:hypothetical protein
MNTPDRDREGPAEAFDTEDLRDIIAREGRLLVERLSGKPAPALDRLASRGAPEVTSAAELFALIQEEEEDTIGQAQRNQIGGGVEKGLVHGRKDEEKTGGKQQQQQQKEEWLRIPVKTSRNSHRQEATVRESYDSDDEERYSAANLGFSSMLDRSVGLGARARTIKVFGTFHYCPHLYSHDRGHHYHHHRFNNHHHFHNRVQGGTLQPLTSRI